MICISGPIPKRSKKKALPTNKNLRSDLEIQKSCHWWWKNTSSKSSHVGIPTACGGWDSFFMEWEINQKAERLKRDEPGLTRAPLLVGIPKGKTGEGGFHVIPHQHREWYESCQTNASSKKQSTMSILKQNMEPDCSLWHETKWRLTL